MRESEVTDGTTRDLEEGQEVKEALKDFFLCGTRRGKKCAICSKNPSSVKLGEEALSVVYKALLLVPSEDYLLKQPSPLWMCVECSNTFNTLADLVFQLEELRCQFNDLRRIVGRQVILGSLGRSQKEWELWEEETRGAEDILTSSVVTVGEKQVQNESGDVCDILMDNKVKIQEDTKLHKMTPVVLLQRLKEAKKTEEVAESPEMFWLEVESNGNSEMNPTESVTSEGQTPDLENESAFTEEPRRLLRKRRHITFTESEDDNEIDEDDFFVPSDASDVDSDEDEVDRHASEVDSDEDATVIREDSSSSKNNAKKPPPKRSSQFSCPRCEKTFITKHGLERHVTNFHDTRKSCSVCHRLFIQPKDLIRHEAKVHSIFPPNLTSEISCTHCDATFTDLTTLNRHKMKRHFLGSTSAGDLQCLLCLKFFADKNSFRQHKSCSHYGGRPAAKAESEGHSPQNVTCFVCKTLKGPLTPEDLKAHEESPEHKQKIRSKSSAFCDVCRLNFAWNLDSLRLHLKSPEHQKEVDSIRKFDITTFCIPCRRNFKNSKQLQSHVGSSRHTEVCLFRENEQSEAKKPCLLCPRTFDLQTLLEVHILRAHAPSGYSCKFCSKWFTHRKERISHQRRSHKDKISSRRKCPHCAATFKRAPNLRKHLYLVHRKTTLLNSPHPCLICYHTFSSTEELESHTKTSHDPFKCPTCGRQCQDRFQLKRHTRTHAKTPNSELK